MQDSDAAHLVWEAVWWGGRGLFSQGQCSLANGIGRMGNVVSVHSCRHLTEVMENKPKTFNG